jgi:hypothetical protein
MADHLPAVDTHRAPLLADEKALDQGGIMTLSAEIALLTAGTWALARVLALLVIAPQAGRAGHAPG